MLGHDPDDPDGEGGNQRVLAAPPPTLRLSHSRLFTESRRATWTAGETIQTAGMVHIGESDASGHDLLRDRDGEGEHRAMVDAKGFLEAELAPGRKLARNVTREAKDIGISQRTLKRARSDLGVVAERVGEAGVRGGAAWYWQLSIKGARVADSSSEGKAGPLNENPVVEQDRGGFDPLRGPRPNGGPLNAVTSEKEAVDRTCACNFPAGRCGRLDSARTRAKCV